MTTTDAYYYIVARVPGGWQVCRRWQLGSYEGVSPFAYEAIEFYPDAEYGSHHYDDSHCAAVSAVRQLSGEPGNPYIASAHRDVAGQPYAAT